MIPEGFDMNALLEQAQEMQTRIKQAQEELSNTSFTGSAGGGLVKAVVSGQGELTSLEISPEAVDLDDLDALSDLIVAAVRDAAAKSSERAAAIFPSAQDMGM